MRFGHGVCVGLRGALAWRNSTLARSRAGLFSPPPPFPPSLSLQLEEMCREQQASLGNGHGDLVEATAAWLGTQKDPEHRERWGPPGLRKNKELKKKKKIREVRLPRAGGRTGDCGMWSRGRGVVLGGKEIFFFS